MRTVAADDLWLSPCHGRATTALHFTWVNDDARVAEAVRTLEAVLARFDPRPHWGKVFTLDAATVRGHYPRLADFRELAARHDPHRKFGNTFLDTYVY
ncbi:D-arabinono-1,4-lactone oxidase [uncultured Jatrophihabitans sp.]|uniref:D-arabinono-1,4-lactone oxidase n=1 Tax=uncultured Jatrophihabitans sp. TaxID=1610747 RepID=UPI0035CC3C32